MTDKEFVLVKRRIKSLLDEWAFGTKSQGPRMTALKEWVITVKFSREPFDTRDGNVAGAHIYSHWHYKQAEIEFNCLELYRLGLLELELIIIHELCHALVNEMREWAGSEPETEALMRHEERVVSELSVAFLQTKYWGGRASDQGRKSGEVGE